MSNFPQGFPPVNNMNISQTQDSSTNSSQPIKTPEMTTPEMEQFLFAGALTPSPVTSPSLESYSFVEIKKEDYAGMPPLSPISFYGNDLNETTQTTTTQQITQLGNSHIKKERNPNANTPPNTPSYLIPGGDVRDVFPSFKRLAVSPIQSNNTNFNNNNIIPTNSNNNNNNNIFVNQYIPVPPLNVRNNNNAATNAEDLFNQANQFSAAKEERKAFVAYRESAELGYLPAIHQLGVCYEDGLGTSYRPKKAVIQYKIAAKKGYQDSMFNLALMYKSGDGVDQSDEKYAKWLKKATHHMDAQYKLAGCYFKGRGVPQNIHAGINCLLKAFHLGKTDVLYKLAFIYFQGRGVPKDNKKGIQYLMQHIATLGNRQAEIFECYKIAANKGSAEAMNQLGYCYAKGKGTPRNLKEAIIWFQNAAMQQHQTAYYNLGFAYEHGLGVDKSDEMAAFYYLQATDNKEALYTLANFYLEGRGGLQKNKKEAFALLTKSHDLAGGDPAHKFKCLKKAVINGDVSSLNKLAICYEEGAGVPENITIAVKLFALAANFGDIYAIFNLGVCYEDGTGVEQNYETAAALYKKAIGHDGAETHLAKLIQAGHIQNQDPVNGTVMLLNAAINGNPDAYSEVIIQLSNRNNNNNNNNDESESDFDSTSSPEGH